MQNERARRIPAIPCSERFVLLCPWCANGILRCPHRLAGALGVPDVLTMMHDEVSSSMGAIPCGVPDYCSWGPRCSGAQHLSEDCSLLFSGISMEDLIEQFFLALASHLTAQPCCGCGGHCGTAEYSKCVIADTLPPARKRRRDEAATASRESSPSFPHYSGQVSTLRRVSCHRIVAERTPLLSSTASIRVFFDPAERLDSHLSRSGDTVPTVDVDGPYNAEVCGTPTSLAGGQLGSSLCTQGGNVGPDESYALPIDATTPVFYFLVCEECGLKQFVC